MDAHRPDELTPQRQRPGHRTDHAPDPVRQRCETINSDELARQIDELEQHVRRDDPALRSSSASCSEHTGESR
jgi:hypothetical protein